MQDNKLITNIIEQFLDLQQGERWLDENFRKKTADLDENQVFERPLPELHSVAELISHILVWRLESIRKIQNSAGDLSADSSESWKTNEQLREIGWRRLRSEFYKSTDMLVNILKEQEDTFLERISNDGYSFKQLVEGLIHHDLYHLGQIGITIKFLNRKK